MKPEIKKIWVDALRSGKYQQGKGCLYRDGKFCCLGVACEEAVKAGVEVEKYCDDQGRISYDTVALTLPSSVRTWMGLKNNDPRVQTTLNGIESKWFLSALNDGGKTFAEIADLIEAQPDDWDGM